jgi:hypothetical protein
MIKNLLLIIPLSVLCGCINTITVEPSKSWEGHYYTIEEFTEKTKNIKLDKDESIWILSNTTLSRLLKNTGKIK